MKCIQTHIQVLDYWLNSKEEFHAGSPKIREISGGPGQSTVETTTEKLSKKTLVLIQFTFSCLTIQ